MPSLSSLPLWASAAAFAAAAAAVWWAGSRLARAADTLARLTGMGSALVGMLLLGGVTSLPEIAVATTAGFTGTAGLAVNNLLGGVAAQVVIIAIGDALLRRRALSASIAEPTVMLQAVFSCLLLALVVAAVLSGDIGVAGVGLWSLAILGVGVLLLWIVSRYKGERSWRPVGMPRAKRREAVGRDGSLSRTVLAIVGLGVIILVAGAALALAGDALAGKLGVSENFVGATLVAIATSLPEISTVVAAVQLRRYMMAFSDIFGTNIFDVMLICLVDFASRGPPVLNAQGPFAAFGATLGIVVTLLYVAGLIERGDRTFLRLGVDSWAVIAVYLGALPLLYWLG